VPVKNQYFKLHLKEKVKNNQDAFFGVFLQSLITLKRQPETKIVQHQIQSQVYLNCPYDHFPYFCKNIKQVNSSVT